jgi:CRP/FNR family cyclic AMP-dependent transcriptional regulator
MLSAEGAADLVRRGRRRVYRKGSVIFSEGDRSEWVAFLVKGSVKASCFAADGRETVMNVVGAGELLGDLSAIDGEPRSATVIAMETTEAVVVGADDFGRFLEEHPSATVTLLRTVTHRLRLSDRRRAEFGSLDVVSRLARLIIELSDLYGTGDGDIGVALTQEELAGWTGASREAVVKALRQLRDRGWIETARRRIKILDRDALARRAD